MKFWDIPLNWKDMGLHQLHFHFSHLSSISFIISFWVATTWISVSNHLCLLPCKMAFYPHPMPYDLHCLQQLGYTSLIDFHFCHMTHPTKPIQCEWKWNVCQVWTNAFTACFYQFCFFFLSFRPPPTAFESCICDWKRQSVSSEWVSLQNEWVLCI